MKETKFTFNFKGGPITVWAFNEREARTLAKAEAIRNGWDNTIIEPKPTPSVLIHIDTALMSIITMEDVDTLDEQLDCIEALKRLRNKLKDKEELK